jgi:hypothetical protein
MRVRPPFPSLPFLTPSSSNLPHSSISN